MSATTTDRDVTIVVPAGTKAASVIVETGTPADTPLYAVAYADGVVGFAEPAPETMHANHPWRLDGRPDLITYGGRGWYGTTIAKSAYVTDRIALDLGQGWYVAGEAYEALADLARVVARTHPR